VPVPSQKRTESKLERWDSATPEAKRIRTIEPSASDEDSPAIAGGQLPGGLVPGPFAPVKDRVCPRRILEVEDRPALLARVQADRIGRPSPPRRLAERATGARIPFCRRTGVPRREGWKVKGAVQLLPAIDGDRSPVTVEAIAVVLEVQPSLASLPEAETASSAADDR
jgi:hypothetical protein